MKGAALGAAGALGSLLLVTVACTDRGSWSNGESEVRSRLGGAVPPQFVCFGSDDNGLSGLPGSAGGGGMHFLTSLFAERRNPPGRGSARTFDGAPVHYSFYVNTHYLAGSGGGSGYGEVRDPPALVARAWREAVAAGNEIGVHTHSHPHGRELSVAAWEAEMAQSTDLLTRPVGTEPNAAGRVGVGRGELEGFRTPYLEYSNATIEAVARQGFRYDCSLEEGTAAADDPRRLPWPYQLGSGSPGNPEIGRFPGLWEVPVYAFVVPPDGACERFGVPAGLRDRLRRRQGYFDPSVGKISGMDWNLWCEFGMSPEEFLATVLYSLELRLEGNRCPLTIGVHSELYSDARHSIDCPTPPEARRAALERLLGEVLRHDEVRVVSARELLDWMEQPVPLEAARVNR